jgi:hypothetical protein
MVEGIDPDKTKTRIRRAGAALVQEPTPTRTFLPGQPVGARGGRPLTTYQCPLNTSVFIGSTSAWIRNNKACTRPTASIACNTNRLKAPVSFDEITS